MDISREGFANHVEASLVERTSGPPPEQVLARAVLARAIEDITTTSEQRYASMRGDAIRFCTAPFGPWAKRRVFWCDAADIDPTAFVEAARRLVAEMVSPCS